MGDDEGLPIDTNSGADKMKTVYLVPCASVDWGDLPGNSFAKAKNKARDLGGVYLSGAGAKSARFWVPNSFAFGTPEAAKEMESVLREIEAG